MPSVGGITWMLSAAGREPRLSGYEVIMGGGPRNVRADLATAAVLPRRWPAFTSAPEPSRARRDGGLPATVVAVAMSKTEDGAHPRLDAPTIVWGAGVVPPVRLVPEKWAPVAHPIVSDDCAATHGQCIFPCQKAAASAAPVLPAEQLVCSQPAPASLMRSGWPCSLAYRFAALVRPPLDQ